MHSPGACPLRGALHSSPHLWGSHKHLLNTCWTEWKQLHMWEGWFGHRLSRNHSQRACLQDQCINPEGNVWIINTVLPRGKQDNKEHVTHGWCRPAGQHLSSIPQKENRPTLQQEECIQHLRGLYWQEGSSLRETMGLLCWGVWQVEQILTCHASAVIFVWTQENE